MPTYKVVGEGTTKAHLPLEVRLQQAHAGRVDLQVNINNYWWDVVSLNGYGRLYRHNNIPGREVGLLTNPQGCVKTQDEP